MNRLIFLSLILSLLTASNTAAQDSTPDTSVIIRSYQINPNFLSCDSVSYDTTINAIHNYNPMYYQSFSNTFLGNTGQAAVTNDLSSRTINDDYLFSQPYRFYIYNPFNIYHFNTRKPYTEIKYLSSGSRDDSEQVLSALHTQNVNQNVNIGVFYDLIASRGIYNNQNTGLNRINLFGSYTKHDYQMYSSLNYNGFKFEENGGLLTIDEFLNRESEALNYVTNLDDAKSTFKNLNFFVTQKLNLPILFQDSAKKEHFKYFSIQHTLNYNRYNKTYTDVIDDSDTSNFYTNNYYLTDDITDSSFYHNISNRFDLNINIAKTQNFKAFIKHEFKSYSYIKPIDLTYNTDTSVVDTVIRSYPKNTYNDISVGGTYLGLLKKWNYSASGQLYITGYRAGDFMVNARFTRFLNDKSSNLTLGGSLSNLRPSYFINNYASANFSWNEDYKNIDHSKAYLKLNTKDDLQITLSLDFFKDYIYFNQEALPDQRESEMFTATLKVRKKFTWGPVNHTHQILLQKGADDYINIPSLAYHNSTWYQNALFKKVLKIRLGVELYYFTEYYADAFMPATGLFYIQKNQKIGNYPFMNAFFDFKLKRTRFTLQYTNALSDLLPEANYFMAYGNPNFSGSLKFGLAWTFYD